MTDHATATGMAHDMPAGTTTAIPDESSAASGTGTVDTVPSAVVAKPHAEVILLRGQKHVPPAGRHSQQSHRRARARAAAEGHDTIQAQHAHDRGTVKAEIGRLAALKAARKTKPLN